MKCFILNRCVFSIRMALIVIFLISTCALAQERGIEGFWEGPLDFGSVKLRFVLKVSKAADGSLTAKADSPDQGVADLPIDVIRVKDGMVHFELTRLALVYDGKLSEESSEIAGTFKQGGVSIPLILKRTAKPVTINRPQEPKKPYPYTEEEISYENKRENVKLAGTLTLPRSNGPFPAVLLITGSGQQDRNETVFGHKPFLVLADYLTRQGMAVLRVDDRGVGGSTGNIANSTSENFAADVLAGIEYLKTRKEINPRQIGLAGHSEGGLIAPMVAAQSSDVAFIVMMAGPGLTGEEILYRQGALIAKAAGTPDAAIEKNRAVQEMMFKALKEEKDSAAAAKRMMDDFNKRRDAAPDSEKKDFNQQAFEAEIRRVTTPWFRYFLTYDPRLTLKKVKCPVLAVNGEKDLQVPPDENLKEIEIALKAAGNRDVSIVKLPALNHLFQTSKSGLPNEYSQIEETIAPIALKTIGDWLLKHTTVKK